MLDTYFQDYFGKYSLDALANCAFGVNPNSFVNTDNSFVENAGKIFTRSPANMLLLFTRLIPGALKANSWIYDW